MHHIHNGEPHLVVAEQVQHAIAKHQPVTIPTVPSMRFATTDVSAADPLSHTCCLPRQPLGDTGQRRPQKTDALCIKNQQARA